MPACKDLWRTGKGYYQKGGVVKTILGVINEEYADLLVSATRHNEYRLFAQSITQELMLKAPCSVLAVKPTGIARRGKACSCQ